MTAPDAELGDWSEDESPFPPVETHAATGAEYVDVDHDSTPRLVIRLPSDLRDLHGADLSWLVERFLAVGAITELTAFIKVGKSTLSAQLIAAVLHGTPFLGNFKADRAPVVLLTEEPPVSLRPALEDAGIEDSDQLYLALWSENSRLSWQQAASEAAALCRRVGGRLLVVDTLSMWAGVEDENDATQARAAMGWLVWIAGQPLAVLVLRQARKSGGEIHNAGRGSGAYGGAADILLQLDYERGENGQPLEESALRRLRLKSRLDREQTPAMKLDYEYGEYRLLEPVLSIGERLDTLTERVLKASSNGHGPIGTEELRRIVRSRKAELLRVLRELTKDGRLSRTGNGKPSDPYLYTSVPDSVPDSEPTEQTPLDLARTHATGAPAGGLVPHKNQPMREEPSRTSATGSHPLEATGNRGSSEAGGEGPRLTCPACGRAAWSPGPSGLPQRRCSSCKHVWTPTHPTREEATQ